ncbi:MAG: HNH endonuclease [Armatimonadetes bacterium]|nr:HNH endonuclease [Armatimonadota bacterium]
MVATPTIETNEARTTVDSERECTTACGSPIRAASVQSTDAALRKRFEAKYEVGAEPDDCWNWTASREEKGYGQFWASGRTLAAHRVAYALHNGEYPPPGLMVCHTCDNPGCVNPAHLYLGTATQNNRECVEKARHGNQNAQSKIVFVEKFYNERGADAWTRGTDKIMRGGSRLSAYDVQEIRGRVADLRRVSREFIQTLAGHYGVSRRVIRGVVSGRTFAWLTGVADENAAPTQPVSGNYAEVDRARREREGLGEYATF